RYPAAENGLPAFPALPNSVRTVSAIVSSVDHRPMLSVGWHQAGIAMNSDGGGKILDAGQYLAKIFRSINLGQQPPGGRGVRGDDHMVKVLGNPVDGLQLKTRTAAIDSR